MPSALEAPSRGERAVVSLGARRVPALPLVRAQSPPAHVPDATDPDVERWWDATGRVVAVADLALGCHWMHVVGVGTFSFDDRADAIRVTPEARVAGGAVDRAYRDLVRPLALQALGLELLHASAVAVPQGVIALCGRSGTGKSTFAVGLSTRGECALWADDLTAFERDGASLETVALPFEVGLRPASADFFDRTGGAAPRRTAATRAPLVGVCVLERADDEEDVETIRLTSLSPGHAFRSLADYAHSFCTANASRRHRMIATYLELVANVPVFEARFRSGFECFPAVVDDLARELDGRLRERASQAS